MAAFIIHNLKQPMAVIRGIAQLLGNPEVGPDKRQAFSGLILADVDRFLEMTEEVLDYSRGMNLRLTETAPGEWLEGFVGSLRDNLAGSGIQVVTMFDCRGPRWIDPERMRRALINTAANGSDG